MLSNKQPIKTASLFKNFTELYLFNKFYEFLDCKMRNDGYVTLKEREDMVSSNVRIMFMILGHFTTQNTSQSWPKMRLLHKHYVEINFWIFITKCTRCKNEKWIESVR